MQTVKHIFLIGFMGCGKTYWGRRLAAHFQRPFFDLDERIEQISGKTIVEIFSGFGEDEFRTLEQRALHTIEDVPPSIIATGGGTPCFFDNICWMNRHGISIFLQTPAVLLMERLVHQKSTRPLLSGLKLSDLQTFIQQKLEERAPYYLQASVVLNQTEDEASNWDQLKAIVSQA